MRFLALVLLLSFYTISSSAQAVLKPADPASAQFSAERLARLDKLVKEYVDNKWIPGATMIVAREGKIVYHKSFGYADMQTKKPLQNDAIFRIASQTKAITSVGIMMLLEEGKLLLDDPVGKYIPEFNNMQVLDSFIAKDSSYTTVPAKRKITIRHLLTHTSGIDYPQIGNANSKAIMYKAGIEAGLGVPFLKLEDQMKKLAVVPLTHQPGERWTYGLNMDLLGYLIEVLSGQSLDQFFKTRIFDPLGMKDTYFYLPSSKHSRLVAVAGENDQRQAIPLSDSVINLHGDININYPLTKGTLYAGGAGLVSTALDYAIFMQMLLNNGTYNGKRLLSPKAVTMMRSEQFAPAYWNDKVMGLAFSIYTDKSEPKSAPSAGSYEGGGFFSSSFWIDPEKKLVAQIFLNQFGGTHGDIHDKFKVLVYAALEQ